jgi:hypothetical protein
MVRGTRYIITPTNIFLARISKSFRFIFMFLKESGLLCSDKRPEI